MQILWPKCDSNPLSRAPNYQTEEDGGQIYELSPKIHALNYRAIQMENYEAIKKL